MAITRITSVTETISKIIEEFNKYCANEKQNEFADEDKIINFLQNTFSIVSTVEIDSDLLQNYSKLCNYLTKSQSIDNFNTLVSIIQSFFHTEKTTITYNELYKYMMYGIHEYFKVKLTETVNSQVGLVVLEYKKKGDDNITYNIKKEYFKEENKCFVRKTKLCSRRELQIAERKLWKPFNIKENECATTFENITLEINKNLNKAEDPINLSNIVNLEKDKSSEQTKPLRAGIKCRNCGIIGHFTYDCPNKQNNNNSNNNNSNNNSNSNSNNNNGYTQSNQRSYHSVIVNHIPSESTVEEITNLFSQVGQIQRVTIPKGYDGSNRNFCFVNFYSEESVDRAIKKFNNTGFNYMIMTVEKAKSKY